MTKATKHLAHTYYRRRSGLDDGDLASKTTQISYRIPSIQLASIDKMANHFGQTRSAFLNDLIHNAMDDLFYRYIEECYQANDVDACDAFLEDMGSPPEGEALFASMKEKGGKLT